MPIINPSCTPNEPQITGPCLLLINPNEMRAIANWARKQGSRSYPLFHGELFEIADRGTSYYLAGPAVGAPMAVLTLEKLIALGAKEVIVYSWCGALLKGLTSGELVIGRWGKSEEGTSSHYPLAAKPDASEKLRDWLRTLCQKHGFPAQEGKIWTTDAPYREHRDSVTSFAKQGIIGVDMEFTALVTVAAHRGITLASLFLVSDELYHEKWQPAFHNKSFKKKSRAIVRTLCQEISQL